MRDLLVGDEAMLLSSDMLPQTRVPGPMSPVQDNEIQLHGQGAEQRGAIDQCAVGDK